MKKFEITSDEFSNAFEAHDALQERFKIEDQINDRSISVIVLNSTNDSSLDAFYISDAHQTYRCKSKEELSVLIGSLLTSLIVEGEEAII